MILDFKTNAVCKEVS